MRTLTVVRILAVLGLALTLALGAHFALSTPPPQIDAGVDIIVDDDNPSCLGPPRNYANLASAVAGASDGHIIFVCDGDYTEPQMQITHSITIRGPGATLENDGVATIHRSAMTASALFNILSDDVTIQGLHIDLIDLGGSTATEGGGDNFSFTHNVVRNSAGPAMFVSGIPRPDNVIITRNHFYDDDHPATCLCNNSIFEDNIFDGVDARMEGSGNEFITNEMNGDVNVQFIGSNGMLDDNTVDGGSFNTILMRVAGDGVTVSNNQLRNTTGTALFITDDMVNVVSSDVTLIDNLFDNVDRGIQISAGDHISVDIGVVPQDANVFRNSGGTLGDVQYLLSLQTPADVNAENNDWGYCLEEDIEAEVFHQPDLAGNGFVDFVPFINPAVCPTTAPTPTPSPSPTPTPEPTPPPTASPSGGPTVPATATPSTTPTPAPTATPSPQLTQGDNDCDGDSDAVDALVSLQTTAGIDPNQQPGCPELGAAVPAGAVPAGAVPAGGKPQLFGDIDCDGDVDAVDALQILRNVAGLQPNQDTGCPSIGDPL